MQSDKVKKFNILEYNQLFMTKIGIYPPRLYDPNHSFFKSPVTFYFLYGSVPPIILLSVIGVFKNWPNVNLVLQGITMSTAGFQSIGMYINIGLGMENVRQFHLMLKRIVDYGAFTFILNINLNGNHSY